MSFAADVYLDNGLLRWLFAHRALADRLLGSMRMSASRATIDPADLTTAGESDDAAYGEFLNAFAARANLAAMATRLPDGGFSYVCRQTVWKVPKDSPEGLLWETLSASRSVPDELARRLVVARHQGCRHFVTERWLKLGKTVHESAADLGPSLVGPADLETIVR
jgi:hypothetical protein